MSGAKNVRKIIKKAILEMMLHNQLGVESSGFHVVSFLHTCGSLPFSLVMCWAGLKPEAEPGPARLSPARPGPKPGLRPGLSTHLYYICIVPSCGTTRQAGRLMRGFFFVLHRSCRVTGSHAARPYGPTLRARCPTLALR